jgi:CHAT domain-containing protein/Tfp pilus assembly protein PilF
LKKSIVRSWYFWIFFTFLFLLGLYFLYQGNCLFQSRYIRALRLMSAEKYDRSIRLLTEMIESGHTDPTIYRKLAETYYQKNEIKPGISCFNHLENENPGDIYSIYGRGYLYQRFKNNEKAAIEYLKIVRHIPPYTGYYKDFIDNFEQINSLYKADSIFHNLIEKDTNNPYLIFSLAYLSVKQYDWDKALSLLDMALTLQQDMLDAYLLMSSVYWSKGQFDKCLEAGKKGLTRAKALNDFQFECIFATNIGIACYYSGKLKESAVLSKKASRLSKKYGQKLQEIRNTATLGVISRETGDYEKSIQYYEKALKGAQQIKDRNLEGQYYQCIGTNYQYVGKFATALDYNNKSFQIANETGNKYNQILALLNLGLINWNLGQYDKALISYSRMLDLSRETGNKWAEGRSYCGIGLIHYCYGYYAKALDFDEKSLAIAAEVNDMEGESLNLGNIAMIYHEMGNDTKALEYYGRALEVSEKNGNKNEIARHLGNIGCTHQSLHNYPAALDYYKRSLTINKEIGDQKEIAIAYGNLGNLMIEMKDYKKAKEYLSQSLKIGKEIGIKGVVANQLINSGFLEYTQANYKTSFEFFTGALKYSTLSGDPSLYWKAHTGMAMSLEKQNKHETALEHYIVAIDKIEEVQCKLPVEEYKSGFFDVNVNVYERVINMLVSMHEQHPQKSYDKLAFRFAERAKARAFLENMVASKADVKSSIDPELKRKEENLLHKISVIQKELFTTKLTKKDRKRLQLEVDGYEDNFEKITREIREKNTKYASLFYPESYEASKVQLEILQDNEVVLEFSLGEECSFLWQVSKDNLKLFKIPGKDVIEKAIQEYINTIEQPVGVSNPYVNHVLKGFDIYNMLLKPCIQEIKQGNHLIIVADGILHYLPFESLVTNKDDANTPHYLIEDFTFSYSPSSTSMVYFNKNRSDQPSQKQLLAYGNPVFGEPSGESSTRGRSRNVQKLRIRQDRDEGEKLKNLYENEGFHFSALPYTGAEVETIAGLFPKGKSVIHTKSDACEESFKNETLENYKYIHFATHGFIEEKLPFRSGIVLSMNEASTEDGILQINEILNLKLNADMVVLSACQTARGKLYRGEGIVGIARAFFYAGSSSVTVCLWNINDRTTAGFMKDFYSGLVNGKDKKDALQQAKLNMIRSEIRAYRHPYYWAPYIVIGNYR